MTTKKQATKLDRKTTARVDAMVIRCADAKVKESCQSLIGVLAEKGITVTFDQLEWSVQKLGLKWRDVFLPATRLERGYAGPPGSKTKEPASGPDMRAVLDRIEQLEQTLKASGLAEYRGLRQQAHEQAQLATERAQALIDRIGKLEKELLEKRYAEYAWLVQHSRDEARLAAERSAALRSDIRTLLHLLDQQAQSKQPSQETQP